MANTLPRRAAALALVMFFVCAVDASRNNHKYYEKFGPYFLQDIVSNPNATDVIISNGTRGSVGSYGAVSVFDDALTVTPERKSTTVARAQGFQVINSLDGNNAIISLTLLLPKGTLSFSGPFFALQNVSRVPCLGGSGDYESVTRGYFEIRVVSFNSSSLDAVLNVTAYYHKEKDPQ